MPENTIKSIFENFSLTRVLIALVLFGLTLGAVTILQIAANLLTGKFSRYRILIASLFPVLRLAIWIGATAFIIFAVFNPPVNALFAVSASAGLAIGLGAQDLIKNIIAGIVILFDRPFRVGDMVDINGHYGEVRSIGLRSTAIQTFDDSTVFLPNSMVLGQAVSNSNAGALDEMVVVECHLPACVDAAVARKLAREAAICSPYTYLRKPVIVIVEDKFERTFLVRLKVKFYVVDIRLERLAASDVSERLKRIYLERGMIDRSTVLGLNSGP
jgi:small-conductance mechanosensitive channel